MRLRLKTFGCKVNFADSEELARSLARLGHQCYHGPADERGADDAPDVIVVNSCAVTAQAVKKARQYLTRLRREQPKMRVIVTGCAVRQPEIAAQLAVSGVDFASGAEEVLQLLPRLEGAAVSPPTSSRTRRFIKVQDGCNSFCSYCIVPHVRRLDSVPAAQILQRVDEELRAGVPEFVVCGTNLGLYRDPGSGLGLGALLRRMLERLPAGSRLRLSSLEPEHCSEEILELFSHPRMCPHLHLPLQSGSDAVLASMSRKYGSPGYRGVVGSFRRRAPFGAVTTDVMVGYPTETEEDFAATCELVRACAFERVHLFRFSPRPGTAAAALKPLSPAVVRRRLEVLQEVCMRTAEAAWRRFVGMNCLVALEPDGCGYGEAYQQVWIGAGAEAGRLVPVKLESLHACIFRGVPVS